MSLVERTRAAPGVVVLTLNDPERRNALSPDMLADLQQELIDCSDDSTRTVVLTAAGDVFSAGGDARRMGTERPSPLEKKDYLERGVGRLAAIMWSFDKPLIAAVNGAAVGAGMDLALWCDLRMATASAYLRAGYVDFALPPGFGAAWRLPQLVGETRALDILLTGRKVAASEAVDLGLFTAVFDSVEALHAEAVELATLLAAKPQAAVRLTKRLVRQARSMHVLDSLDIASSHFAVLQETPDHAEAVQRFKDRRQPKRP